MTKLKAGVARTREKLRRLANRAAGPMEGAGRVLGRVWALVRPLWWKVAAFVGFVVAYVGVVLSPPASAPPMLPRFPITTSMPLSMDQLIKGIQIERPSWVVHRYMMTIQDYILAFRAEMPLSVAVQVGAVALLTIPVIGFVTALLRRKDGGPIPVSEPPGPAGTPPKVPPRYFVEQGQSYVVEIGFQRQPPQSYSGAQVSLVEGGGSVWSDVIVEGAGIAVEGESSKPFYLRMWAGEPLRLEITPQQPGNVDLRIGWHRQGQWITQLDVALTVVPDYADAGVAYVSLPGGGAQPMLCTLDNRPEAMSRASRWEYLPESDYPPSSDELRDRLGLKEMWPISAVAKGVEASTTLPAPAPGAMERHLSLNLAYAPNASTGRTYAARATDGGWWRAIDVSLSEDDAAELNKGLQQALEAVRRTFGQGIEVEASALASEEARASLDDLARLGNAAFKRILPRSEDRQFVREALAQAKPANLEISSDRFFLPWELLYDPYHPGGVSFSHFWGLNYNISRVLTTVRQVESPVMRQAQPRIALYANPELQNVKAVEVPYFRRLEDEGQIRLWDWLKDSLPETETATPGQQRSAFVQYSREHESEVAHFACHAVTDPAYGFWSYLVLSPRFQVSLVDLDAEDYLLGGMPVVVLNACGTGVRDPRKTSDFVQRFMLHGGRGVVATECDVPDAFASVFIQRVYDQVLKGETFGLALLAARRYFWEEHHNPLGLLYAAYTRLETRIVPGQKPGKQA